MKRLAGQLGVFALQVVGACEKQVHTDTITTLGIHTVVPGELSVRVYDDRGKINFRICRTFSRGWSSELGPSNPAFENGAKWFIIPESPRKFWVFDGNEELFLRWFAANNSGGVASTKIDPEIVREAPKRVLALLPKSLKDKYKNTNSTDTQTIRLSIETLAPARHPFSKYLYNTFHMFNQSRDI